jgi:hypothetical protein
MAGTIRWHRRALAGAAVLLTVLGPVGCGGKDTPGAGGTPTATGDGQLGGAPSSTATTGATGGPATSGTSGNSGPVYPKGARSYAQELLKAWGNKDYGRIGLLADQATLVQIRDSVNAMGVPNTNWTYISCVPDSSTNRTACEFHNANGDKTVIQINNAQLGAPTAVVKADLDRTAMSTDVVTYVQFFTNAWADGNYERMVFYSNTTVATYFKNLKNTITSATWNREGPDLTYVRISGLGDDLGESQVVQVDPSKIMQGKAHGIVKANPPS